MIPGMPIYDSLMGMVVDRMVEGHEMTFGETIALAAEVRAVAEAHPTRYATQDIQLMHCHCATFVVRLGTEGRWWHPGSKTHCDDENPTDVPSTQPVRQIVVGVGGSGLGRTGSVWAVGGGGGGAGGIPPTQAIKHVVGDVEQCAHCHMLIELQQNGPWVHKATGMISCPNLPRGRTATPRVPE